MIKSLEFKLYPNKKIINKLEQCLEGCSKLYNEALTNKINNYNKNKIQVSLFDQYLFLTDLRVKSDYFRGIPVNFERDALKRVDRAFKNFFRRLKNKEKVGFPRFKKSKNSYKSLEYLEVRKYIRDSYIFVPGIGSISAKGIKNIPEGVQKVLIIIRKASGWYAQVTIDTKIEPPVKKEIRKYIGIDLGLMNFIATSDGELIKNPKFLKQSEEKLKFLQRKLSKRVKGSSRYKKLSNKIARLHEKISNQRRLFCHEISTQLVKNNDLIVLEDLKIENMVKGRFAKQINDACWGRLKHQLKYKAENAGTTLILVDPKHTSQTCPDCGEVVKKELDQRIHNCKCGCSMDRDVAAAKVILKKGLQVLEIAKTQSSPRDEASKSLLCEVNNP